LKTPTPEQQAILDAATRSIERMAVRIVEMPQDRREVAFAAAKISFQEAFEEHDIDPELGGRWVEHTLVALRRLVTQLLGRSGPNGGQA
jgi:hypothetical protein